VTFACANRFCATAFVEMMAPAISGTLFNNERRQMPLFIELDGFVMQALLTLPRNKARFAGEKPLLPRKVPALRFWRPVASGQHHDKAPVE